MQKKKDPRREADLHSGYKLDSVALGELGLVWNGGGDPTSVSRQMNVYAYKAVDRHGQIIKRLQVARDEQDLRASLKELGFTLVSISKRGRLVSRNNREFITQFLKRLMQLLSNKLDLITSLEIAAQLFSRLEDRAIVEYILASIRSGCSLSASFSKIGCCFDGFIVKTIEIAEKTSRLTDSLTGIIEYLEAKSDIAKNVKNAMRYPIILACCVICVTLFWLIAVVPKFAELFTDVGVKLPLLTKIIVRVSAVLSENCMITLISFIFIGVAGFGILRNRKIMDRVHKIIPVTSKIKKEMYAMNFFYAMGMMIQEKIHLMEGLECVASIGNQEKIQKIISLIKHGTDLSSALRQSGLFSKRELSVVAAGEKSGDMWPAFKAGANMIKSRVDYRVRKAVSLLQPVTIILIGGMLIVIVCSVIAPIYSGLEFCY
ncbi:MAG: type II secretion system F family protein [Holosporales bacterium]|jgi:type IV pilus assembly protein PilC|nr:type II secretion system F family protein [Holosporales bacterium]